MFKSRGFSLIEFIIALAIATLIVVVVTYFARNLFVTNLSSRASLNAQLESRKILQTMVSELRSTSPSAVGAYAVESVATSSIIFFADVNNDDYADRIRYFLDTPTRTIKRGVVLASGSPPSYNLGSETIATLISDVSNDASTPLFDYYNTNSAILSYPINLASLRMIKVTVRIDKDTNRAPLTFTFSSNAVLRNLKDNL